MSEHHGHNDHEPWKQTLAHAFKDLQAADQDRDARLRHNQEEVARISREIISPVCQKFIADAQQHGFQATVNSSQANKHQLNLTGGSACTIDFVFTVSPDAISLTGSRQGAPAIALLNNKKPDQLQPSDIADFLAAQLLSIKPKRP